MCADNVHLFRIDVKPSVDVILLVWELKEN